MAAYYNEIDPYAAQWLRNLIVAGHIAPGDVDERSIADVQAGDLAGYDQCHFFAGIGGWSLALRLAGWPDDRPVWTGSCPCQPFSAAGAGKAADDERHLWPAWFPLIAERRPAIVFGEQVEAAIGWGWLDAVFADLEGQGYACGASVLPACGVGAPHIRQRLWFVADADGAKPERRIMRLHQKDGNDPWVADDGQWPQDRGTGELGDPSGPRLQERERVGRVQREAMGSQPRQAAECGSHAGDLAEPTGARRGTQPQRAARTNGRAAAQSGRLRDAGGPVNGFWSDAEWIACTDGKARPVGPGSFPLGHGIPNRASKLRAYGNAIVPQVAAEFIAAASEAFSEINV